MRSAFGFIRFDRNRKQTAVDAARRILCRYCFRWLCVFYWYPSSLLPPINHHKLTDVLGGANNCREDQQKSTNSSNFAGIVVLFCGRFQYPPQNNEKRITIMMPWSKPTHSRNLAETLCHHLDGLIPLFGGVCSLWEAMEANTDCRKRVECFQWDGGFNPSIQHKMKE